MDTKSPFTLISAELAKFDEYANLTRIYILKADLERLGLSYTIVQGVYKGKSELTFLVTHQGGTAGDYWPQIVELAKTYEQESVLHVGSDRHGSLYYPASGKWEGLGKFREVSEDFAKSHDAYTQVGDKFYYCG